MFNLKIYHKQESKTIIHLPGVHPDSTLCGTEVQGDESLGLGEAEETSLHANCEQCIAIAEHVRALGPAKSRYRK